MALVRYHCMVASADAHTNRQAAHLSTLPERPSGDPWCLKMNFLADWFTAACQQGKQNLNDIAKGLVYCKTKYLLIDHS